MFVSTNGYTRKKRRTEKTNYSILEPRQLLAADIYTVPLPVLPDPTVTRNNSVQISDVGANSAGAGSLQSDGHNNLPRTRLRAVPDLSRPHTTEGNYRADYADVANGSNDNWQFSWNAPGNWSTYHSGNQNVGAIGESENYRPLFRDGYGYRPTGSLERTASSGFLSLNPIGGHAGVHAGNAIGNGHDRYAIAAFTVDESGYYSIADSFLSKVREGGDGIEVIVHVGDDPLVTRESTAPGDNYRVDFDTNLGFMRAGETVYVAVGAGVDHAQDQFEWNFSIVKFEAAVVGDFVDDFSSGESGQLSRGQWQYLANAPGGSIGEIDGYLPLVSNGTSWISTATGNAGVRIGAESGLTGATVFNSTAVNRYAITKFTVDQSGYFAISDSFVSRPGSSAGNLEIIIHNNVGDSVYQTIVGPNEQRRFDQVLGFMEKGESLYVAVGGSDSGNGGGYELDFTVIAEPMVRPDPLLEMETIITVHVDEYGAVANDQLSDHVEIQNAIDDAIAIQDLYDVPVLIQMGAGTYRMSEVDGINLFMRHARDIQFSGQGAGQTTLLVTNARSGLMRILDSHDVLISDFAVDYETLPFTQGTVVSVVNDHTLILDVDPGYVAPDAPHLFTSDLTTHRTQFLHSNRSGRLVNGSDFYKSIKSQTTRNADGTYTVTYHDAIPESLRAGDAWYQIARINNRSIFGMARNTGHISYTQLHAYASPGGFVSGQYNEMVDVVDNQVKLKDGRLVSVVSDIVHIQRSKFGPWVENNRFIGPADDVIHVYRFLEPDLGLQNSPNEFRVVNGKDLFAGDEILFFREDGYRRTATIVSIESGVLKTDQPIDGYTPQTSVVPLEYSTAGSVIRDNTFGWHRAGRGSVVVFSPDTTIIGNHFQSINSHAIQAKGYEDFTISDGLIIQGNSFRDIGFKAQLPAIDLDPFTRDLTIVDNVFAGTFGESSIPSSDTGLLPRFNATQASLADEVLAGDNPLV